MRRDHSRWDPKGQTPRGWGKNPESDDYTAQSQQRTTEERNKMYALRRVDTRIVLLPNDTHRSHRIEKHSAHRSEDGSRTWRGTANYDNPQLSAVAVYLHGLSNYASLRDYVELSADITEGLVFARPQRCPEGSFQGTAVFQYRLKEQAMSILEEIVPRNVT